MIMKKSTLLKMVMSLALSVVMFSAFGQANYTDLSQNGGTTNYVTEGTTMPYVVAPDQYYNPDWTTWTFDRATTDASAFVNNTWTWTLDGGAFGANATITTTGNGPIANITWNNVGTYTLGVTENNASFGTCDGAEVTISVQVVQVPEIVMTSGDAEWCSGGVAPTAVELTITEADIAAADGGQGFTFSYDYQVDNVDADDNELANVTPTANTPVNNVDAGAALTNNADGTFTYTITPAAMTVQNNQPTRYMWTINKADGISSQISRTSDYMIDGGTTTTAYSIGANNDDSDQIVKYTIFPAPVTGPIYHIPNGN